MERRGGGGVNLNRTHGTDGTHATRPTRVWRALEELPTGIGVAADWQSFVGGAWTAFQRGFLDQCDAAARSYCCSHECGCAHRVVHHDDGSIVAVCECDPWNCDNISLTATDVVEWEFNRTRLARAMCRGMELEYRPQDLGLPWTQQVATFSSNAVPVVMTIQQERHEFRQVVAELATRWREGFILFTPTSRFVDGRVHELLSHARAKFYDIESHFDLTPSGELKARRRADEMFATFVKCDCVGDDTSPRVVARNGFCKTGSYWAVTFGDAKPFPLPPTLGAEYLNYLLHHPSQPISAYDLERVIRPEKAKARTKDSIQNRLDTEAIRSYLRQLDTMRHQRDEAAEDGDLAKADELDGEIVAIESELQRNGQAPDAGERSRGNVSKAITAVQRKLRQGEPNEKSFGQHLDHFISLGYECCYNQPQGNLWD